MVCVNSGIFMTESGSSRFDLDLLNQEMVLENKNKGCSYGQTNI